MMGTPPPLPKRQTAANNKPSTANEIPKIPARTGAPPPLPARRN